MAKIVNKYPVGIQTFEKLREKGYLYVDNGGNAQLGYGDQYVRYNATTGKVEFGSGVSLNWRCV